MLKGGLVDGSKGGNKDTPARQVKQEMEKGTE